MSTIYVKFQSDSDTVLSNNCTTRWSNLILCNIPISGIHEDKYTNLMVMTGDEELIRGWISENSTKVVELSEEEGNTIGQEISPEGTTIIIEDYENGKIFRKTYTAGEFTITNGQIWTLTDTEDITPVE